MHTILILPTKMEQKNHIVFYTLIAMLLTFSCMVDSVKSSLVTHSTEENICAGIIGPSWTKPKHEKSPCPNITVWVPKKGGFTEFVKLNKQNEVQGGFSIAIFCKAISLLPFEVKPVFKAFINKVGESNGTYDQLVQHIKGKKCEAVAGDVTIRGNRTQHVSFTSPYLGCEIYMLVHGAHEWNETLWTFLRPFTWRAWITIVGMCIITGVAIAFLEYRVRNPRFTTPFYWRLVTVMWFSISTFFFKEGKILNGCSKVVLVTWLSMIFIVVQIFTATLSSWLTLDQLRPRVSSSHGKFGYQDGSFLRDFIVNEYNCSENDLFPLKNVEEYKMALSNGSVNAVLDELPYIQLFLNKYGNDYMKVGPIKQESGLAFAFARESPLLEVFTRAVINVTEDMFMMRMREMYLRLSTTNTSEQDQALPKSLDVKSFIGLMVFMGIVILAAILSSEIILWRKNNKILPEISEES